MQSNLLDDEPVSTRAQLLSKTKALSTARNVVFSRLGSAVIRNNTQEVTANQLELYRIESQYASRLSQLDRSRKQFVATRRRAPEPMLIVHRPPGIELTDLDPMLTVSWQREAVPVEADNAPGYLKPTLQTAQSAPIISTIDAFRTIKCRSPSTNVMTLNDVKSASPVRFRSAVVPSWPLSEDDQSQLRVHRRRHLLRLRTNRRYIFSQNQYKQQAAQAVAFAIAE